MTEAWKDRIFTNATVETTIKLKRTAFLSEEDWQRAIREGGTFNLRGGFRVYIQPPGVMLIADTDCDPVDLKWSASFEPVEPQSVKQAEFWWVRVRYENGDPGDLQLAEVEFEGDAPRQASLMGTCASLTPEDMGDLSLIERVLPAGRAAAAVSKLSEAWSDTGSPGTANDIAAAIDMLSAGA
jgi:hypothetical protein